MTATPRRGQVTGQGHVGDAISSLATAQASEAEVVKDWRELLFQADSTELQSKRSHSQTTRTRANNAGRAASSQSGGWGGSQVQPTRHSPGQARQLRGLAHLPRVPLQAVLIQWAAKVAFFRLKLDQLMDSLCRVCLAESKQNLQDRK